MFMTRAELCCLLLLFLLCSCVFASAVALNPCTSLLSLKQENMYKWGYKIKNKSAVSSSKPIVSERFACKLEYPLMEMWNEEELETLPYNKRKGMLFARETISTVALTIPIGPHKTNWQEPLHDQRFISKTYLNSAIIHNNNNSNNNYKQAGKTNFDEYVKEYELYERQLAHNLLRKIVHRLQSYMIQLATQIIHYPWYHLYAIQQLFYERRVEIKYVVDEYTRAALVHIDNRNHYNRKEISAAIDEERGEESFFSTVVETNDGGEVRIKSSSQGLLYNGLYKTIRVVSFPPQVSQSTYNVERTNAKRQEQQEQHEEHKEEKAMEHNNTEKRSKYNKTIAMHQVNQGELMCSHSFISRAHTILEEYKSLRLINKYFQSASHEPNEDKNTKSLSTSGSYVLRGVTWALSWVYHRFVDDEEEWERLSLEEEQPKPFSVQYKGKASNSFDSKEWVENSHDMEINSKGYYSNSANKIDKSNGVGGSNNMAKHRISALHMRAKRAIRFLQNTHEELGPFLYSNNNNNNDNKIDINTLSKNNNYMNAYMNEGRMGTTTTTSSSSSSSSLSELQPTVSEVLIRNKKRKRTTQPFAPSSSSSSLFSLLLTGIKSSLFPSSSQSTETRETVSASMESILPSWVLQWIGRRVLATSHKLTEESFTTLHTLSSFTSSHSSEEESTSVSDDEAHNLEHYKYKSLNDNYITNRKGNTPKHLSETTSAHYKTTTTTTTTTTTINKPKSEEYESQTPLLSSVEPESSAINQNALKVYHTKVWFHFTAHLSASRAFCLAVEAVPHPHKTFSSLSSTQLPEHLHEVKVNDDTRISNLYSINNKQSNKNNNKRLHLLNEPHVIDKSKKVDLYVSQMVYFDNLWLKLFLAALTLYYTQSFLIKSNLVHFMLAGLCGLLVLAVFAIVYVIRKVKQMTVGQASMVLVLAMGGVTAFTEGVLVIVRYYAETIKENLAGEWAVYVLVVVLVIASCSSIAARLLFPPSSLEITSKICVTLITYGLWIITFMRRREATLLALWLLYCIRYFVKRHWQWKRSTICAEPHMNTTYASAVDALQRAKSESSHVTPSKQSCLTTNTSTTKPKTSIVTRSPDKLVKSSRESQLQEQQQEKLEEGLSMHKENKKLQSYHTQSKSKSKSKSSSQSCERDGPVDDLPPEAKRAQKFITPLAEEGKRYAVIHSQIESQGQNEVKLIHHDKPLSHAEKMRCYSEEGAEFTRKALDELAHRLRESPACYVQKVRDPNRVAQWAGSQYESSFSDNTSSDDMSEVSSNN